MIELGHFATFLALGAALAQGWFGLRGQRDLAGLMAISSCTAMAIGFGTIIIAFARSDFSVALVANHSHTLKPFLYKIAGTWGNHEGSMALWCLVTTAFGAAGAWLMRTDRPVFEARALGVQGLIGVGALVYLLFASSPFTRLDDAPLQGASLNPLLQDPALAIHPPLLYLGYVGYSFVFALAAAGLIEGRIDRTWAKVARGWAMAAFVPLTIGIMLGSYWAYYELGWGGWWFWDPVENASFMPWLIGAALLHSVVVTEKRGSFAAWTALLAVLAFCFSILGAFLVRSGILTSVHAFAVDPLRGSFLLAGLCIYGGAALALFAWRAPSITGGPAWALKSREGALMANNIVVIVATLTVLLGTLFPLMAEAAGWQMSVGEPYFNLTFAPIMTLALILLPVVQAWSWGQAEGRGWVRWAAAFVGLMAVIGVLGFGVWDMRTGAVLGIGVGLWLIAGAGIELWRRAKTPGRLFQLPLRVWGMSLAHAGIGVFMFGAVIETTERFERTLALSTGESAQVAGWTLTLNNVRSVEGPNWYADEAALFATKDGEETVLSPQKRFYPAAQMPTTETAIHKTASGDLYAALGDFRRTESGQVWTFRVYFNPLIDLIYIGVILISLGAAMTMIPRRRSA
ncbi:MAG: heme lyase CcmF/NrfE family subunit [Pseudomonadota bacterium]